MSVATYRMDAIICAPFSSDGFIGQRADLRRVSTSAAFRARRADERCGQFDPAPHFATRESNSHGQPTDAQDDHRMRVGGWQLDAALDDTPGSTIRAAKRSFWKRTQ